MKLFSTEITTSSHDKTAKAVLLKKTRSGYSFLDNYITEPENLKSLSGNYSTFLCIDYVDTIIESLNVPPVKDPKTFKLLAKNKLKENMEEGVEYLMAYKADGTAQKDKSGKTQYKVYMIPEKLFEEDAALTRQQKLKINMFTLSDFAVMSVSNFYFPDDVVFHAFADEFKILIAVSKGDTIIYSRTLEYEGENESIESVFYESINLTYMYVSKNMRVDVDRMVFSGKLMGMTELSRMLFEFNRKAQSVIIHSRLISNCSKEIFHQFMIPVSLCMLDDAYDFTPEPYKIERGFNRLKRAANIVALTAVLLLAVMNFNAFDELGFAKERLSAETNTIGLKLDRNIQLFTDTEMSKYGFYYIQLAEKNRNGAFDLFSDVSGLLETADYENVRIDTNRKTPEILINGSVRFDSFKEIDAHRQSVNSRLERIRKSGKYKISDTSKYDMDRLSADMTIKLEKIK